MAPLLYYFLNFTPLGEKIQLDSLKLLGGIPNQTCFIE
jgi:hypothetical protein